MQRVIFQSLYADPGLSSLKHALFYFGKLRIPKNSFAFADSEDPSACGVVALAPEHVCPHLEFLEKEGHIEFTADEGAAPRLLELIAREAQADGRPRTYRPTDLAPVFGFLEIHPRQPGAAEVFSQVTVALAAVALQGVALGRGLPCVDNRVLFDLMNVGLKGIFESFVQGAGFSPSEVQELKARYVGQRLLSMYLPSFEFKSFDDVLEARQRLRDQLANLTGRVEGLSDEVTARPWEPEFHSEVTQLIAKRVEPELQNLRKSAHISLSRIAGRMAVAGVVLTMQGHLPEMVGQWLVGGSAVSLWEAFKRERDKTREVRLTNAFSLLLQVPF